MIINSRPLQHYLLTFRSIYLHLHSVSTILPYSLLDLDWFSDFLTFASVVVLLQYKTHYDTSGLYVKVYLCTTYLRFVSANSKFV